EESMQGLPPEARQGQRAIDFQGDHEASEHGSASYVGSRWSRGGTMGLPHWTSSALSAEGRFIPMRPPRHQPTQTLPPHSCDVLGLHVFADWRYSRAWHP